MPKLRWAKWQWSDWAGDAALSLCSHAAQSIWMRLLCIAAQAEPYGSILIAGEQPTEIELAALMRPRVRVRDFRRYMAQLERNGVAKRDPDGTLFSARMRADAMQIERASRAGMKSAEVRRKRGLPLVPSNPTGTQHEPNTNPTRTQPPSPKSSDKLRRNKGLAVAPFERKISVRSN